MFVSYHIVKCFEKMIVSDKNYWSNWKLYSNYEGRFRLLLFEFILCLLSFPSRGGRTLVFSSKCNIEQAEFTYCMSFQPSKLIEEISRHPEVLSSNTKRLESAWNS